MSISILGCFCLQQTGPPFAQDACLLWKYKSVTVNHHHLLSFLDRSAPLVYSLSFLSIIATVLHTCLGSFSWLTFSCLSLPVVLGTHQTICPMFSMPETTMEIYNSLDTLPSPTPGSIISFSHVFFSPIK